MLMIFSYFFKTIIYNYFIIGITITKIYNKHQIKAANQQTL